MVCAFLPLFTMRGPEGQLFGPMAETYAFALAGGLLLAVLLSPVLCLLLLRNLKPAEDNFLVRWLKASYLRQLRWCLRFRWTSWRSCDALIVVHRRLDVRRGTGIHARTGRGQSVDPRRHCRQYRRCRSRQGGPRGRRAIMQHYPEVETIVSQLGRPDDGTDTSGFNNVEFFVPLKPQKQWPAVKPQTAWRSVFGAKRPRTKLELINDMNAELPGSCSASTGTSRRTSATTSWNRSPASRATTR